MTSIVFVLFTNTLYITIFKYIITFQIKNVNAIVITGENKMKENVKYLVL